METFIEILKKDYMKKIFLFITIGLFFYFMRSMLNLFLLTFLFTYIINQIEKFIIGKFKNVVPIKETILTIVLYVVIGGIITFIIYRYIPIVLAQGKQIMEQIHAVGKHPQKPTQLEGYIMSLYRSIDLKTYVIQNKGAMMDALTNVGRIGFNVFISLILSLFFMLEKKRVQSFLLKFKNSKVSGLYDEISHFGRKFLNSFGKVIEAQLLIAITNSILSAIALTIMGFPQILGLAFMIFVLSLIPVAGVIISLVPLCLIAFKLGGLIKIVYVLVMIAVLHAIESYILNPKFMSAKTELPVFFTFMILIVSEHFMGVWGLIIGIPIFMFILDLIDVKPHDEKLQKELKK